MTGTDGQHDPARSPTHTSHSRIVPDRVPAVAYLTDLRRWDMDVGDDIVRDRDVE